MRWSGSNGQGENNFPLSWKQKNQPANGNEPNMMWPFGPRQSALQEGQAVTRVALALGMSEAVLGEGVHAARS